MTSRVSCLDVVRSGSVFFFRLVRQSVLLHGQFPLRWQAFPDSWALLWVGVAFFGAMLFLPDASSGRWGHGLMITAFFLVPVLWAVFTVPDRRWSVAFLWSMSTLSLIALGAALFWPLAGSLCTVLFNITALRMAVDAITKMSG